MWTRALTGPLATFTATIMACGLTLPVGARAAVYLVLPDGSGDQPTIQAAIDVASAGDRIDLGDGIFTGDGNRDLDFLGKAITIRSLSDDPESCIINCEGSAAEPHRAIRFGSGEGPQSVVRGITISNGYTAGGPGEPEAYGGAIHCDGASPTLVNCTFLGNTAEQAGGAIWCDQSAPTIEDCTFASNSAGTSGGGVILLHALSPPRVTNCAFIENSAVSGAGLRVIDCDPEITGCLFFHNTAVGAGFGGGVHVETNCTAVLTDCTFAGNIATTGGALRCADQSDPILDGCVFSMNSANMGGAIYCQQGSAPTLISCTLTTNSAKTEGGGIALTGLSSVRLEQTLIAYGLGRGTVYCEAGSSATIICSNLFGNLGGDWVGCIADQLGEDGNISAEPQFCSLQPDHDKNWGVQGDSPCAPAQSSCGLIGAGSVACGTSAVEETSWGRIKASFDGAMQAR